MSNLSFRSLVEQAAQRACIRAEQESYVLELDGETWARVRSHEQAVDLAIELIEHDSLSCSQ